ncbi:3-hydroxyacyl-CoA dehydrogenase family protein [Caulobacter sp. RL271]|uniref:3-hydroxyacyl-CoA dehydrogenase family protein n=1 Tax=Caulobacter segnis TaxID=88688 RepID=A0ABY4ZZM6_9CAUL|nr:3-hydroxyacyl-CoA dehydrogenase family protein [Caulobacter segnis]USQ98074.1 3-hydroxyacyl-CoA dehydrogenase family protein [Caulobacter segnis]
MKIGVVGAGLMGGEIALVFALGGFEVLLNDRDEVVLQRGIDRLATLLDKGVARGMYAAEAKDEALARITPATDIALLSGCDLVSEAVFEALEVKQEVLKTLDAVCQPDCILTSNTSTLPISTLSAALAPARRPRFIGAHFFSPVSRMALVEVIPSFDTALETSAPVVEILRRIGKSPIVVKDVAGFAVNRLLHAMLIEAVKLVEEGVATPEDLDTACRLGLGHPIGPFALMDAVSSGLCLQVQQILHDAYGERFRPPALLKQRVAGGFVGGAGRPGWTTASGR